MQLSCSGQHSGDLLNKSVFSTFSSVPASPRLSGKLLSMKANSCTMQVDCGRPQYCILAPGTEYSRWEKTEGEQEELISSPGRSSAHDGPDSDEWGRGAAQTLHQQSCSSFLTHDNATNIANNSQQQHPFLR